MFARGALPPAGLYITLCLIKSFNKIWLSVAPPFSQPLVTAMKAAVFRSRVCTQPPSKRLAPPRHRHNHHHPPTIRPVNMWRVDKRRAAEIFLLRRIKSWQNWSALLPVSAVGDQTHFIGCHGLMWFNYIFSKHIEMPFQMPANKKKKRGEKENLKSNKRSWFLSSSPCPSFSNTLR